MTKTQETLVAGVAWLIFWVGWSFATLTLAARMISLPGAEMLSGWAGVIIFLACFLALGNLIWSVGMRSYRRHLQPRILAHR